MLPLVPTSNKHTLTCVPFLVHWQVFNLDQKKGKEKAKKDDWVKLVESKLG